MPSSSSRLVLHRRRALCHLTEDSARPQRDPTQDQCRHWTAQSVWMRCICVCVCGVVGCSGLDKLMKHLRLCNNSRWKNICRVNVILCPVSHTTPCKKHLSSSSGCSVWAVKENKQSFCLIHRQKQMQNYIYFLKSSSLEWWYYIFDTY